MVWRSGLAGQTWIGATVRAVVLGAAGFGIGFWVGGGLGAGIGAAAGVVAGWVLLPLLMWFVISIAAHGSATAHHSATAHSSSIHLGDVWSLKLRDPRYVFGDDLVRRALAELVQPGRLLFNPPDRMRLGQMERVEVRLTRALDLDAELLAQLGGHGEPQLEEIATASRMAVTLTGDGFDITRHSEEEQAVTQDGITSWEFDIRAVKRGQQRLFMSVSLRFPVPGQPLVHKNIPVREVTIDVQVGVPALVGQFVSAYWQWLIGTAVAIAAVVVVFYH